MTSGDRDAKIAPPLRTAEDNEGLWRGIQNGTIDTVASDHAPKLKETKDDLIRGVPPIEVFPAEDLIQCGEAALRQDPDVLLQYGRSPGKLPCAHGWASNMALGLTRSSSATARWRSSRSSPRPCCGQATGPLWSRPLMTDPSRYCDGPVLRW